VNKAKPIVSRIQLIDPEEEEEWWKGRGSLAVKEASRVDRRFASEIAEKNAVKPQALWFCLDSMTGEVALYSRAAATRLEGAFTNNRATVPMAGLGGTLEDAIVHLGTKHDNVNPVQKSLEGGQMDVRRLKIKPEATEICVNVVWEDGWHIVDTAVPGTTEERHIVLQGTEMVRPPTPPLPPLNPDRRLSTNCLRHWGE